MSAPNIRDLADACIDEITQSLIRERKVRTAPKFKLDPIQKTLVDSRAKFARVLAPAGAGKTRTLLAKADEIIGQSPDSRVLCLTFTNAAANEFKERAVDLAPAAQNRLTVSTVNSFGKRLSDSVVSGLRTVTTRDRSFGAACKVIKAMMAEPEWQGEVTPRLYRPIFELSDLCKTLGFHHASTSETATRHYDLNEHLGMAPLINEGLYDAGIRGRPRNVFVESWLPFWSKLTTQLWASKVVSLDDQKYWALELMLDNERAQGWLFEQGYTDVLVDEFQDINKLELLLIQQLCATLGAGLIIVGDDDQCIYEWRGCTSEFIRNPSVHMRSLCGDEPFETIILENNYRCPRNIVRHANQLIDHNDEREPKRMNPVRDEDANIQVIPLPAAFVTLNVVDRLLADIEDTHPKHTVAVVGRKKCQLIPIQILLAKRSARFRLDDDLNVFRSPAWKDLRAFMLMIPESATPRRPSEVVEGTLRLLNRTQKTPFSKMDVQMITDLLERIEPSSIEEAIDVFGRCRQEIRRGYAKASDIAPRVLHFLESESVTEALLRAGDSFKGFAKDFGKAKDDIFYTDPPFSHLADLAVSYDSDVLTFIADMDIAAENLPTSTERRAKLEVMTALRTKGREFDTVIVLDANDGIWPNKLSEENGHLEEERRLFYVTVTRAKNNLLMFDSGRVQGKHMVTSRFIEEMGISQGGFLTNAKLDELSQRLLREMRI